MRPSPNSPKLAWGEEVHYRVISVKITRGRVGKLVLVVWKRITGYVFVECFGWIAVLRKGTEVEDMILVLMPCIKETLYVPARVSIQPFDADRREPHYNYLQPTL